MKQITEDYCSYEIAKLLKEKRFKNEYCDNMLLAEDGDTIWKFATFTNRDDAFDATMKFKKQIPYVTHQLALKWLREVHKLHIITIPYAPRDRHPQYHPGEADIVYIAQLFRGIIPIDEVGRSIIKLTHEEACEAAIKYCLENLI